MSYDHHDAFRDRLNALPLGAGRRGIAAMVLVEIVRWTPDADSQCSKTAEALGDLLNLRIGDVLLALETLGSLGVIEQVREGAIAAIHLRPMAQTKTGEQLQAEIAQAIQSHSAWKRRLRHAIDTGSADFTVEEVARDDLCEFGRWLAGASFAERDRDGPYKVICHLHAQFHRVAAATLQLALSGRQEDAERAMSASGAYSQASLRLSTALNSWRGSVAT